MIDHPRDPDELSIPRCQIDISTDTCTPHEHKSVDDFADKVEASEAQAAIRTLRHLGYTYHGAEYWKPPVNATRFYTQPQVDALIAEARAESSAIMQAITDPEKQPSQFGTVTIAHMNAEVEAERARCLEELKGMLSTVKTAPLSMLLSDCRAYAENLLTYLVDRIEKK